MIKILFVIQAEGDVRIHFQYQEMLPPVMPRYVGNCEKAKICSKTYFEGGEYLSKEFCSFCLLTWRAMLVENVKANTAERKF